MSDRAFKDHFSGHAAAYAQSRPEYPPQLFRWLAGATADHVLAWDAATGNGQAARALAGHYLRVHATDASAEQLGSAHGPSNVRFTVEPAEACSLADGSADLVTVAQALHWFEVDAFYAEARRVLKPGGLLAAWTYRLNRIAPDVDAVVRRLYRDIVGEYWPPERRHVEAGYSDLPFPFEEIEAPEIAMQTRLTLPEYLAYLCTWSASQRYRADRGEDPVARVAGELERAWGAAPEPRTVHWPLVVRAGYRSLD